MANLIAIEYPAGVSTLDAYTPRVWVNPCRKQTKASCLKRLNRIEGQVRGFAKMGEEGRYCIDIVTQISAVRAALRRVEEEVLSDHSPLCRAPIASGNAATSGARSPS
jgi:DNA-binding FrmR family transcriptional regulator